MSDVEVFFKDLAELTDELLDLLWRLVDHDPWSSSMEGLDDACMYCDSDYRTGYYSDRQYRHYKGCVWIEAMDFLGRPHPQHVEGDK